MYLNKLAPMKYLSFFLLALLIALASCSSQQTISYAHDDIYLTKAELDQKRISQNRRFNTPETSNGISEDEYAEEYYDEDYSDKMAISPYSPIYDPFWGPPSPWTRPGWNSSLSYGYNPWMGNTFGVGIGYTWGNAGFNNPYNQWNNPWYSPYGSFYNPWPGSFYNPSMFGMPMMGMNNPYFWNGDMQTQSRLVTPRFNLNNNYRSNAVNRQFIRNASQGKEYKKSNANGVYSTPSNNNNQVNPNINYPSQRARERQNAREVVKPDANWQNRSTTTPARQTAPSRNNWTPPSRPTSPTRTTPSRNRRY